MNISPEMMGNSYGIPMGGSPPKEYGGYGEAP
jgi:hypothetical protein